MKQTEILTHATHVNGWVPAVYMSCLSQNFRLFHLSNLSVRNFRIFLLMYSGDTVAGGEGVTWCNAIDNGLLARGGGFKRMSGAPRKSVRWLQPGLQEVRGSGSGGSNSESWGWETNVKIVHFLPCTTTDVKLKN